MANATVFEPEQEGMPFVAAVFGENGLLVASRTFPSRAEAESFIASDPAETASEVLLPEKAGQGTRGIYDDASE